MFSGDTQFEDEVRRIARLLWPSAEYGGAANEQGRERDGLFETDEVVHVIECTTSRTKSKAESDGEKLKKLAATLIKRHPFKAVKGYFVTLNEPTADQKAAIAALKAGLVSLSFDQFRSKLIDARTYLSLRNEYRFGSVRDPETGQPTKEMDYIPLDLVSGDGAVHSVDSLIPGVSDGRKYLLLGDYGAGKSSTMRELFMGLAKPFWGNDTMRFPMFLNLRDHHGQTDPTEAIERHARKIGFSHPSHLVRAWRAGLVTLMLDGFDEIATAGWAGKTKTLKDLRYRSMELVRSFMRETPLGSSLIISGRGHFFDSELEMRTAIEVGSDVTLLTLNEFTEQQVAAYLSRRGWTQAIPSWLPTRPLLLGYLASRQLLDKTLDVDAASSPVVGWNALLERIAAREAEIEAGLDADTVRHLIERLAIFARVSRDGLGPLSSQQITEAFSQVCGYPPDDRGMVLLQRLPGLGRHSNEDDARVFVDRDFVDAAAAGDVYAFVQNPFVSEIDASNWFQSLAPLGIEVLAYRCKMGGCNSGKMAAALKRSAELKHQDTLCVDILRAMQEMEFSYSGPSLYVRDILVPALKFGGENGNVSGITFQDAFVGRIDIGAECSADNLPRFVDCYFGEVEGRSGHDDLPVAVFSDGCVFEHFEATTATTNAILAMDLPLGVKVLLTVLKKLFAQRGSGRRESAFFRGLGHREQRLVGDIMDVLKRRGIAIKAKTGDHAVWLPTRTAGIMQRVGRILAAPNSTSDVLLQDCSELE